MKRFVLLLIPAILLTGFLYAQTENIVVPYIIKAPNGVTVDGNLEEWAFAFPLNHNQKSMPDSGRFTAENPAWFIQDAEDCSGTLYMMYDDEYLYLAASVMDEEPGHFSDAVWAADGIEFYIGNYDIGDAVIPPVHADDTTPDDPESGDYAVQIGIYFDESEDSLRVYEYFSHGGTEIRSEASDVQYFIWPEFNGYTIEGKIALSDLESPTTGNTLEFTEGYRVPMTWSLYDIDETESSADFTGFAYTPKGYAGWQGPGPGWQSCDVMGIARGTAWNDNAEFDFVHPFIKRVAENRPVEVDGDLGEWNWCFPLDHNQVTIPDSGRFRAENPAWFIQDAEDCSGTLYMMYDDEYLYLAGSVMDEEPGHFSDAVWAADGIEFYMANYDMGDALLPEVHADDTTPDDAESGDYALQLGIYFDESEDSLRVFEYFSHGGTEIRSEASDVQYFIWPEFNGYTIEGKIALADLESPTTGNTFEFTEGYRLPMTWSLYDIDETESSADFTGFAYTPQGYAGWQGPGPGWQYSDVKGVSLLEYIDQVYPNITAIEDEKQLSLVPSKFSLKPNYPNPFNPSTRIAFSMEKASKVNLKIYDITGKLVKTLINNELRTAGSYEVSVDMSGHSSGVYFAELSNGAERLQQKMLLVK